jgi:hypothetical protein
MWTTITFILNKVHFVFLSVTIFKNIDIIKTVETKPTIYKERNIKTGIIENTR